MDFFKPVEQVIIEAEHVAESKVPEVIKALTNLGHIVSVLEQDGTRVVIDVIDGVSVAEHGPKVEKLLAELKTVEHVVEAAFEEGRGIIAHL